DDGLSDDELDLICGMHRVITEQIAYKSWWPSYATWSSNRCGLNIGYWSFKCEQWYQEHLRLIRSGHAALLSRHEWDYKLKRFHASRNLRMHSEKYATSLI
ncbi:hypothetical protein B0H10DRAFT_1746927, partial [Mycena sp. CBHHK59/15]